MDAEAAARVAASFACLSHADSQEHSPAPATTSNDSQLLTLQQQVCSLRDDLEAAHTHYQQLLDKLAPRWRHDRSGLEGRPVAAIDMAAVAAAAMCHPGDALPHGTAALHPSSSLLLAEGAGSPPVAPVSPRLSPRSGPNSPRSGYEAARSMLERQLEAARRDLRSAQHSLTRMEGDMAAAAEGAAWREAVLSTQLRKTKAAAAAAASTAAEERAALASQVRTLIADIVELKAGHTAQLTAAQQQLHHLSQQLAAQQVQILQHKQLDSTCPQAAPASISPALSSPAAAGHHKAARAASAMEASGSGKPASKAGVKPHWMVSGTAALVREHYHKDLTYAGAMIDSNVHKDISAAVNGSSSSSGLQGGSSGLSRCRPASAPAGRADKNSSALNDNSSSEPNKTSTTAAAEGSQERRQVESRVRAELQHRTEQLLRARGATCPSTGVQQQGGGEAPVSDVQQQQEQQLVLAEYVVLLQDELSRLKQQLQSEQQCSAALRVAVRSVQRSQAAAAGSFLAGTTRPDSPVWMSSSPSPSQQQQHHLHQPVRTPSAVSAGRAGQGPCRPMSAIPWQSQRSAARGGVLDAHQARILMANAAPQQSNRPGSSKKTLACQGHALDLGGSLGRVMVQM